MPPQTPRQGRIRRSESPPEVNNIIFFVHYFGQDRVILTEDSVMTDLAVTSPIIM